MVIFSRVRALTSCLVVSVSMGCATQSVKTVIPLNEMWPVALLGTLNESVTEPVLLSEHIGRHRATVFYWWSNSCPCVRRYQTRIESLMDEYRETGIGFVAIASNSDETEKEIMSVSSARQFKLPIAIDHGGHWAEALSVMSTPTVVVIDSRGRIIFRGWLDNERMVGATGRVAYLEDVLESVLAGNEANDSSPIYGCRITRDFFASTDDCDEPKESSTEDDLSWFVDFN